VPYLDVKVALEAYQRLKLAGFRFSRCDDAELSRKEFLKIVCIATPGENTGSVSARADRRTVMLFWWHR
jgi:hypothetical protein